MQAGSNMCQTNKSTMLGTNVHAAQKEYSFGAFQYDLLNFSLSTSYSHLIRTTLEGGSPAANTRHRSQDTRTSCVFLLDWERASFQWPQPWVGWFFQTVFPASLGENAAITMGIRCFPGLCSQHRLETRNYCSDRKRAYFSLGIWA